MENEERSDFGRNLGFLLTSGPCRNRDQRKGRWEKLSKKQPWTQKAGVGGAPWDEAQSEPGPVLWSVSLGASEPRRAPSGHNPRSERDSPFWKRTSDGILNATSPGEGEKTLRSEVLVPERMLPRRPGRQSDRGK